MKSYIYNGSVVIQIERMREREREREREEIFKTQLQRLKPIIHIRLVDGTNDPIGFVPLNATYPPIT
ncbi:MAG: hypothetical protein N7Q72_02645, partial [Spiroplasma sp. Tabriz.8]|nr:hypothetical protein [Spiroplasma sp. Tabriz.8]